MQVLFVVSLTCCCLTDFADACLLSETTPSISGIESESEFDRSCNHTTILLLSRRLPWSPQESGQAGTDASALLQALLPYPGVENNDVTEEDANAAASADAARW